MKHKDNGTQCDYMCERIKRVQKDKEETVCCNVLKWKSLNNKNLIEVFDVILQYPTVYIVMEYATGKAVKDALKNCTGDRQKLQNEVVIDWARQIAQGLSHLHDNDIVHKDIKSAQSEFFHFNDDVLRCFTISESQKPN